jgi:hypothetical protein
MLKYKPTWHWLFREHNDERDSALCPELQGYIKLGPL